MLELKNLLNNSIAENKKQLFEVAGLLSSDEDFIYNSTYTTDRQKELDKFNKNIDELSELLFKYSEKLDEKLRKVIKDNGLTWCAFKLQINNSIEVKSDDLSLILVVKENEQQLLKLLTTSNIASCVLSLHFKYSRNKSGSSNYNDSFDLHIQHSFKVENEFEIEKSITKFLKIVKLHINAG